MLVQAQASASDLPREPARWRRRPLTTPRLASGPLALGVREQREGRKRCVLTVALSVIFYVQSMLSQRTVVARRRAWHWPSPRPFECPARVTRTRTWARAAAPTARCQRALAEVTATLLGGSVLGASFGTRGSTRRAHGAMVAVRQATTTQRPPMTWLSTLPHLSFPLHLALRCLSLWTRPRWASTRHALRRRRHHRRRRR